MKRCGKRAHVNFPYTVEELKKNLIKNYDKLPKSYRSKINKTSIRGMRRKELCKHFTISPPTKKNSKRKLSIRKNIRLSNIKKSSLKKSVKKTSPVKKNQYKKQSTLSPKKEKPVKIISKTLQIEKNNSIPIVTKNNEIPNTPSSVQQKINIVRKEIETLKRKLETNPTIGNNNDKENVVERPLKKMTLDFILNENNNENKKDEIPLEKKKIITKEIQDLEKYEDDELLSSNNIKKLKKYIESKYSKYLENPSFQLKKKELEFVGDNAYENREFFKRVLPQNSFETGKLKEGETPMLSLEPKSILYDFVEPMTSEYQYLFKREEKIMTKYFGEVDLSKYSSQYIFWRILMCENLFGNYEDDGNNSKKYHINFYKDLVPINEQDALEKVIKNIFTLPKELRIEAKKEAFHYVSNTFKIHLMPKKEYLLSTVRIILELLIDSHKDPSDKDPDVQISNIKFLENPNYFEPEISFGNIQSLNLQEQLPYIVIYPPHNRIATQKLLFIFMTLFPSEYGANRTPRYNEKVNNFIYYAAGDADVKKKYIDLENINKTFHKIDFIKKYPYYNDSFTLFRDQKDLVNFD